MAPVAVHGPPGAVEGPVTHLALGPQSESRKQLITSKIFTSAVSLRAHIERLLDLLAGAQVPLMLEPVVVFAAVNTSTQTDDMSSARFD